MPDRQYLTDPIARRKRSWFLLVLCVIALAYASCSDAAAKPLSPSRYAKQPLIDSVPSPLRVPATATPRIFQITAIDDIVEGTGPNQFNYVGSGWGHCYNGCNGCHCYDGTWSGDDVAGDSVTVSFTGVQINFYVVIGPDGGIGAISLDGGSETMIDFYSTEYTGDLLMWSSPMMPESFHTFKLRVTGTKDPSSKDYNMGVDRVDILS